MSDQVPGTAAAAMRAHSKDAMPPSDEPPDRAGVGRGEGGGEADDGSAADAIRGAADGAMDAARRTGAAAADAARTAGREVTRRGAQAGRLARRAVGDDPLLALLVAGAVGFALGLAIGRR